jgi:hypothetical protein
MWYKNLLLELTNELPQEDQPAARIFVKWLLNEYKTLFFPRNSIPMEIKLGLIDKMSDYVTREKHRNFCLLEFTTYLSALLIIYTKHTLLEAVNNQSFINLFIEERIYNTLFDSGELLKIYTELVQKFSRCGLYKSNSTESPNHEPIVFNHSCYVFSDNRLYYYDHSLLKLEEIHGDETKINQLRDYLETIEETHSLSYKTLKNIRSMTGHSRLDSPSTQDVELTDEEQMDIFYNTILKYLKRIERDTLHYLNHTLTLDGLNLENTFSQIKNWAVYSGFLKEYQRSNVPLEGLDELIIRIKTLEAETPIGCERDNHKHSRISGDLFFKAYPDIRHTSLNQIEWDNWIQLRTLSC